MRTTFTFRLTDQPNPTLNAWCTRCLPSGAVWSSFVECDDKPYGVLTVAVCLECGEEL